MSILLSDMDLKILNLYCLDTEILNYELINSEDNIYSMTCNEINLLQKFAFISDIKRLISYCKRGVNLPLELLNKKINYKLIAEHLYLDVPYKNLLKLPGIKEVKSEFDKKLKI